MQGSLHVGYLCHTVSTCSLQDPCFHLLVLGHKDLQAVPCPSRLDAHEDKYNKLNKCWNCLKFTGCSRVSRLNPMEEIQNPRGSSLHHLFLCIPPPPPETDHECQPVRRKLFFNHVSPVFISEVCNYSAMLIHANENHIPIIAFKSSIFQHTDSCILIRESK